MFSIGSAFFIDHQNPFIKDKSDSLDRFYLKGIKIPTISKVCLITDQLIGLALVIIFALAASGVISCGPAVGYVLLAGAAFQLTPSLLAGIWLAGHAMKAIILQEGVEELK